MAETLESYLVGLGIKGQDVVLSTIDKITSKGEKLKKSKIGETLAKSLDAASKAASKVNNSALNKILGTKGGALGIAGKLGMGGMKLAGAAGKGLWNMGNDNRSKEQKQKDKEQKESFENNKFVKATEKMVGAAKTFAAGAASLNPIEFMKGAVSAAGDLFSGVPFASGIFKSGAGAVNMGLGMAGGAVESAKSNSASYYQLAQRNANMNNFGSNVFFEGAGQSAHKQALAGFEGEQTTIDKKYGERINKAKEKEARDPLRMSGQMAQIDAIISKHFPNYDVNSGLESRKLEKEHQSKIETLEKKRTKYEEDREKSVKDTAGMWTPNEQAQLIGTVRQTFGKIQEPLGKVLSSLTQNPNLNPESVTAIASGNYASMGTDKGFFMQQIANQLGNLPPSVAQSFQATLLSSLDTGPGGDIQQQGAAQKSAQKISGTWEREDERQVRALFQIAQGQIQGLLGLNSKLNEVQQQLIKAGSSMASSINGAADDLIKLINKIKGGTAAPGR